MLQYLLLKTLFPVKPSADAPIEKNQDFENSSHFNQSKFESYFGKDSWLQIKNKTILDFGCGSGKETIAIAKKGVKQIVGLDIRPSVIAEARTLAQKHHLEKSCFFTTDPISIGINKFDIIISQDAFEHYNNPEEVLNIMKNYLAPQGEIWISFGPPWYHPKGGHLFSVFPWAHLLFSEKALIKWRADFKTDGAKCFNEVEGGLNQMTLSRFKKIIKDSGLQQVHFQKFPIRILSRFSQFLPEEFICTVVVTKLKLT